MSKGSLNISLETVIGLVLAAIIIPGLFFFSVNLLDLVTNKPEQSTLNGFDGLMIKINQLVDGTLNNAGNTDKTFIDVPYFIQNDYGLIGFDSNFVHQTCGLRNIDLKKPISCLPRQDACFCLDKSGWGLDDVQNWQKCQTIKDVRYVYVTKESVSNSGTKHDSISEGNNLALWSGCDQGTFGVKNIRISKIKAREDSKIYDLVFQIPSPITS